MSLSLVTVRARTRGKTPAEFQFQGIGRLSPRRVSDKDGNDILVDKDGKTVKYVTGVDKDDNPTYDTTKVTVVEGKLQAAEGYRFVEVDDVNPHGLTNSIQEVLDLFGTIPAKTITVKAEDGTESEQPDPADSPMQRVIDYALDGFNYLSRKDASPVAEPVASEDEFTPLYDVLVSKGYVKADDIQTWRRNVTQSANAMDMDKADIFWALKPVKLAVKAGDLVRKAA